MDQFKRYENESRAKCFREDVLCLIVDIAPFRMRV
jgi:hypothetical protein